MSHHASRNRHTLPLGRGAGLPAPFDFVLVIIVQALFLVYVIRKVGAQGNERRLLSLSLGLMLPIATIGVAAELALPLTLLAELALPLTLLADLAMVLFFRKLWGKHGGPSNAAGRS